jgi:glycosyltransferase involved in cell wall biosynthesis
MHVRKSASGVERFVPLRLLSVLLRSTLGLVWGILCSPADMYHLGKPQPVNGLAALLGVCLLRRSFYLDCDDDETTGNRFSAGWQRAVFAFWQWLMPRLATGVTVNTPFLRERMERAGIAPVVYVPNGVDLARFRPLAAERLAALRWALGLEQRRVIVYLGSIALQNHPVDLLLDAFVRIATVMPETALLIVGDGEDLPLLQQRAVDTGLAARVRFVGRVPQAAAPAYLALAEISADPVYDNPVARARSPLKLFESLALGVPVVTGDVGDRRALLDGAAAGVLVTPGDAAALAEGLREVLDNPRRRHVMAQAGLRHIQRYGWDTLAATWVRVYHRP